MQVKCITNKIKIKQAFHFGRLSDKLGCYFKNWRFSTLSAAAIHTRFKNSMENDQDKMNEKAIGEASPEEEMTFLEHLEELRWRLIRMLIGLVVGMIICFILYQQILDLLILPASRMQPPLDFQFLKVQGMFTVIMEIGFFGGLIISLPFILYQLWGFVAPALMPKERRYIIPLMLFSTLLFGIGLTFAYYAILPMGIRFLVGLAPEEIAANIAIDFYIGFVIRILFLFGVVFELPILSYFLSKIGLLTANVMQTYRRHGIITIFVVAALLTPPDPLTQIALGIPLILLYEFSIVIVRRVEKNAQRKALEYEKEFQDSTPSRR